MSAKEKFLTTTDRITAEIKTVAAGRTMEAASTPSGTMGQGVLINIYCGVYYYSAPVIQVNIRLFSTSFPEVKSCIQNALV